MKLGTVLSLVVVCAVSCNVHAADVVWDGGAYANTEASLYWTLPGNWNPDGQPAAGQSVLVNISDPYAVADADLPGTPAIEVAVGGLVVQPNNVTISSPITLSGGTWSVGTAANFFAENHTLNGPLAITADSKMAGVRWAHLHINGALSGNGQLTFECADYYQDRGTTWNFYAADSAFSGPIVIDNNYSIVVARASRALGTGDITVRPTGSLSIVSTQDYSGAARTPTVYLEGGRIMTGTLHASSPTLQNATIPFDIVVQSQGGTLAGSVPNGWGKNNTYSGSVTLDGPLTLVGTRCDEAVSFTVSGRIAGDYPVTLNTTDEYNLQYRGQVVLSNPANSFASLTIQRGYFRATNEGALSTGPITIYNPDALTRFYLDKPTSADWTLSNDITASGPIQVEDGSANYTLNLAGSDLTVGASSTNAANLSVAGNLAFARDGAALAALNIDIIGSGSPLVVTNDRLAVNRSVSGLANANLNISISGLELADVAGQLFTIVTSANDLSNQEFASVTCPTGWAAVVTYGNNFVKVQLRPDTPEPVIVLNPESLNFSVRSSEANPAPSSVQVKNAGSDSSHLNWTATVLGAPAPSWITLSNTTGTDDDSFIVHIDRQAVPVGTHTAVVEVRDPSAANSPQTLTVTLQARPDADASTHSFTNSTRGTHPSTLSVGGGNIDVNLSSLPAGTQIFRAILVPHSTAVSYASENNDAPTRPLQVQSADAPETWLQTVAPLHVTLDCTAAAQRALLAEDKTLHLNLISYPAGLGSEVRLDVWCDAPAASQIQQVTNMTAVHRSGDTMLTFAEVNPPVTEASPSLDTLNTAKAAMDTPNEIRYRIYRSSQPIDALTIRTAELVNEISPMSGWNWNITTTSTIPTLPTDNMVLSTPGTGIYVRRAQSEGTAYYAISRAVNGEEDLSLWMPNVNSVVTPVTEAPGTGMVLQYAEVSAAEWLYVNNITRKYFVKWECPPNWNVPNYVHNYLVGVPSVIADPCPVAVGLHGWGGTMDVGFAYWLEANHGSLFVATNQDPYDWWTAFHENRGTIRPWTNVDGNGGGVCRNYTQNRIWSFVNGFVANTWNVDPNHVILAGVSMGGSGASMWGIRAGDKFAYIDSWVGVHIARETPWFKSSYATMYGIDSWNCLYQDTGMSVWDYWDDNQWLRSHVSTDTPFIAFANGKNDGQIGWSQAVTFARALQETRRPHLFRWAMNGHGERAILPGTLSDHLIDIDIDLNKTLPAFTNCSLDQNPGNGDPEVGDSAGALNQYMLWQPEDSMDTASAWEMTCLVISQSPADTCTVDITPRRCQAFKPAVGTVCNWTNTDIASGNVIASGTATVDAHGLITIPQTTVSKTKNRIRIMVSSLVGDINKDGYVNVGDLQALVAAWGSQKTPPSANWNADADVNADDYVNVGDLQLLVAHWGEHL